MERLFSKVGKMHIVILENVFASNKSFIVKKIFFYCTKLAMILTFILSCLAAIIFSTFIVIMLYKKLLFSDVQYTVFSLIFMLAVLISICGIFYTLFMYRLINDKFGKHIY